MAEPGTADEDAIRLCLALNRVMQVVENIVAKGKDTIQHDATKRAAYLDKLITDIHHGLFQDSRPQRMLADSPKGMQVRETIQAYLCANGGGHPALFDSHGFGVTHNDKELADILAGFYVKMREVKPFAFGNELTLDVFMLALGKLPAFEQVQGTDIALDRLNEVERNALHNPASSRKQIAEVLLHAFNPSRRHTLDNKPDQFPKWPNNSIMIGGIPFLSHVNDDGTQSLVTVNGGLVAFDKAMERNLLDNMNAGNHLITYATVNERQISGQLQGTEELRNKPFIDGYKVTPDKVPLVCLDLDMITGLRPQDRAALEVLIGQVEKGATIFSLSKNDALYKKLRNAATSPRLKATVDIAYGHVTRSTENLDALKDSILAGKTPSKHPLFCMSMGGAGVGKSGVREYMEAKCGSNFVTASLDDFRSMSDVHKVLLRAGHHWDDYTVVDPFANTLRTWVANAAKEQGINVLYDGTGIDYNPRYAKTIADFKAHGFATHVMAVDAPLETAIERIISRFGDEQRALPWPVVIGKHVNGPRSFADAVPDAMVDKIALFANDGTRDRQYLVAESFVLPDSSALENCKTPGELAAQARRLIGTDESSVLRTLGKGAPEELIDRIPGLKEHKVAFMVYPSAGQTKLLMIYDTRRFRQFTEKGGMNPNASSLEGVLQKPAQPSWQARVCEAVDPGQCARR